MQKINNFLKKFIEYNKTSFYFLLRDFKIAVNTPYGILYFILGLLWISLYIFIRFFRDITGYKIVELQGNVSFITLLVFVFFVIIHFSILAYAAWQYYVKITNRQIKNLTILFIASKCSDFVDLMFWKPLDVFYRVVRGNIPGSGNFTLFLETFFVQPFDRGEPDEKLYFTYLSIFVFDILPKVIVSVTFFIEVIFYAQVDYFLKFLPLVVVPILFKIFVNIMVDMSEHNLEEILSSFVEVKGYDGKKIFEGRFTVYKLYLGERVVTEHPDEWYIEFLELIPKFKNILIQAYLLKKIMEKFLPYVSNFTSSLYFIAGLVRLYIIFFF